MKKICTSICFIFFSIAMVAQSPCTTACTESSTIDGCAVNDMSRVTDFRDGSLYYSPGNCPDGFCPGSVWRFLAVNGSGSHSINATVTIDALVNARIEKLDDDEAADLNGSLKTSLFAPAIKPDMPLTGVDRKGYVQFTVRFFLGNIGDGFSLLLNLSNLSAYQYDLDGDKAGNVNIGNNGNWFKETAFIRSKESNNPQVKLDAATELTLANYVDEANQWVGGTSSSCSKAGLTTCAQNTMAFSFSKPQYAITFRLGYDFNAGGDMGQPVAQYGIKFGCFYIPGSIQLPVNLYEFSAKRDGTDVHLSWATTYEQMNQGFRVQRKTNGSEFEDVAFVPSHAPGGNSQIKLNYTFTDPNNFKGVSQYRIIQTDLENKIRVSEIRSVPGESAGTGIVIYPNPATNGSTTIVFDNSISKRNVVLTNVFGQQLKRWTNISSNTITVDNLFPGIYSVIITDQETGGTTTGKFAVTK